MSQVFRSGKQPHNYGKSPFLMGKSTVSMAMFNSKLLVYQRVLFMLMKCYEYDLPWPTTVPRRSPSRAAPRPRSGRGPAAAGAAPQPGTRCGRCARSLAASYAERKAVGRSSGMIHSQLKLKWMLDGNGGNLLWFLDEESKIVKFGFNSHGLSLLYPFVWYFGVKKC